jgi:hypothetical protein
VSEVVVLVPVLGRPHRVVPTLESIAAATTDARVLFIPDPDDREEIRELRAVGAEYETCAGNYARKINIGYCATSEPLVFLAADDLDFKSEWLTRASSYLTRDVDVVGTNDICNPRVMCGQHSTHSLVRRSYVEAFSGVVDEPGKVLHEGYAHEYCDDEFVQTAMARGRYAHAFDAIVEHLHPLTHKAADDATYRKGRAGTRASRRLFQSRRPLWQT